MITEGKMQYLYDDRGRRYLDVSLEPPQYPPAFVPAAVNVNSQCHLPLSAA